MKKKINCRKRNAFTPFIVKPHHIILILHATFHNYNKMEILTSLRGVCLERC